MFSNFPIYFCCCCCCFSSIIKYSRKAFVYMPACMLSYFSFVWLCDPMECSLPGSSVHRILQARLLEWVAMPSSRVSSQPRDWTCFSCLLHWQAGSLRLVPPGKPSALILPQVKLNSQLSRGASFLVDTFTLQRKLKPPDRTPLHSLPQTKLPTSLIIFS